ncbi:glutaredoxin family protein [Luteimonas panaciterrae]|uniref:glutaredoxin family protein n=1 Tax=Luteimonas panaciterrae TaxID=363885 RepID=UPI001CFADFDE|nr:glutaredoxin domain-containing protein [Luteimonas panaciterrae]
MRILILLLVLGLAGGLYQYSRGKLPFLPGAETQVQLQPGDPRMGTGETGVVMLMAEWCGYCAKLRKDFELANVRYRMLDVDTPEGDQAMQAMGLQGVPVLIVGQDVVHGYQPSEIRQLLEPLGYRL